MFYRCLAPALLLALASSSSAQVVTVTVTGEIDFNQTLPGPFSGVAVGDVATFTFELDPVSYVDSTTAPLRGYIIDAASFDLSVGGVTPGLAPISQPFFSLRDDDSERDGFLFTEEFDFFSGVPLDAIGSLGEYRLYFSLEYVESTIFSLDIQSAAGTYDLTGLTAFNWTITDGAFDALGLTFTSLTISTTAPDLLFRRGDVNDDGSVNIADAVLTLDSLFVTGDPFICADAADSNDDGAIDVSDAIALLGTLFVPGFPPVPAPGSATCGVDPSADALACPLTVTCP